MLYGSDLHWWKSRGGVPEFAGLKLSASGAVCIAYPDVHKITVRRGSVFLCDEPGVIGSAENSGFQAVNLALQFGARRIVLVGFDLRHGDDGAAHWHGDHRKGLKNPSVRTLARWCRLLDAQRARLDELGVEMVNTSMSSALTAFEKMPLVEALKRWECRPPPA